MIFGTRRGRHFHASEVCAARRLKDVRALTPDECRLKTPCPRCAGSLRRCTACYDATVHFLLDFPCDHQFCGDCAPAILSNAARTKDTAIRCPCCTESALSGLNAEQFHAYVSHVDASDAREEDELDNSLNMRCPHCRAVFTEFDGCAALQCSCGRLFCAFCLAKFDNNPSAHAHVLECAQNPNRGQSYYVTLAQWLEFVEDKRREIMKASIREASPIMGLVILEKCEAHDEITPDMVACVAWFGILRTLVRVTRAVLSHAFFSVFDAIPKWGQRV